MAMSTTSGNHTNADCEMLNRRYGAPERIVFRPSRHDVPIVVLANQYGTLFVTGTAAHPGSALSGIVLIAMVLTLAIAAVISRNLYKKTGNIWLPAFLNALLMTTMTIANTMVAFK